MTRGFSAFNVVATFGDASQAREAIGALHNQHFEDEQISLLAQSDEARVSQEVAREETEELPAEVARTSASGAAVGGAAGGLAGLVAGAAAFAIPGVGPAIGAGIWAATAGGAAAGATAGGVAGGISKMWEERYQDAVMQGSILIGVHDDDAHTVGRAGGMLERQGSDRLDYFDAEGHPIAKPGTQSKQD